MVSIASPLVFWHNMCCLNQKLTRMRNLPATPVDSFIQALIFTWPLPDNRQFPAGSLYILAFCLTDRLKIVPQKINRIP